MHLYEVVYHGAEGRDDDADTLYLVRAQDFRTAIEIASGYVSPTDHGAQNRPITPHVVFEIGKDLSVAQQEDSLVLRGPYYQCAYNHGWRSWERKARDGVYTNDWEETTQKGVGS